MLTSFYTFGCGYFRPYISHFGVINHLTFHQSVKSGVVNTRHTTSIFPHLPVTKPGMVPWKHHVQYPSASTKCSAHFFCSRELTCTRLSSSTTGFQQIIKINLTQPSEVKLSEVQKILESCVAPASTEKIVRSDPWFRDFPDESTNKGLQISAKSLAENLPKLCQFLLQLYPTSNQKPTLVLLDDLIRKFAVEYGKDTGLSLASAFTACMKICEIFSESSIDQPFLKWNDSPPEEELDFFQIPYVAFFKMNGIPEIVLKLNNKKEPIYMNKQHLP